MLGRFIKASPVGGFMIMMMMSQYFLSRRIVLIISRRLFIDSTTLICELMRSSLMENSRKTVSGFFLMTSDDRFSTPHRESFPPLAALTTRRCLPYVAFNFF